MLSVAEQKFMFMQQAVVVMCVSFDIFHVFTLSPSCAISAMKDNMHGIASVISLAIMRHLGKMCISYCPFICTSIRK